MNSPLVSIIIPTYSRPKNLCRAIDCVIQQTYNNIEIIVVDDNGEGTTYQIETEKLLQQYISKGIIRYIKHTVNKNGSAARNTGVRFARGNYIGFLDDDDIFDKEKIELQIEYLKSHQSEKNLQGVYCNTIRKNGDRTTYIKNKNSGILFEEMLTGKVQLNSSTIIITKEAYNELGGFDERYLRHQDWEFCLRFFKKYAMALVAPEKFLVTKNATENINTRDPFKAADRMDFFINNFKEDIDKLPSYKVIYTHYYEPLVRHLFKHGFIKRGWKYYWILWKYNPQNIVKNTKLLFLAFNAFIKKIK